MALVLPPTQARVSLPLPQLAQKACLPGGRLDSPSEEARLRRLWGAGGACRCNGMLCNMSAFPPGGPDLQLPVATATMGQTLSKGDTSLATFSVTTWLQYQFVTTGW